jgi:hypothetical protein
MFGRLDYMPAVWSDSCWRLVHVFLSFNMHARDGVQLGSSIRIIPSGRSVSTPLAALAGREKGTGKGNGCGEGRSVGCHATPPLGSALLSLCVHYWGVGKGFYTRSRWDGMPLDFLFSFFSFPSLFLVIGW